MNKDPYRKYGKFCFLIDSEYRSLREAGTPYIIEYASLKIYMP